jgi:hypothetical protein
MKDHSQVAIQYSGYPLSIADLQQKPKKKGELAVLKAANDQTTSVQENKITNDPGNWDMTWFNNYE